MAARETLLRLVIILRGVDTDVRVQTEQTSTEDGVIPPPVTVMKGDLFL